MAFNLMSQAESKINTTMGELKNANPGGKIPEAAALAELKNTVPNVKTLQSQFASDSKVSSVFTSDF